MLCRLAIKDFILIDNLEVDFHPGFNLIAGETGAGKSMLIGALMSIMGSRTAKGLIRKGADASFLQASFELDFSEFSNLYGLDENGGGTLIFSKEIQSSGRTYSKINGQMVTQKEVQGVAQSLISFYGQEDRSLLFNSGEQLKILDAYTSGDIPDLLNRLSKLVSKHGFLLSELKKLDLSDDLHIQREIENLEFQISDIDEAALSEDDEDVEERYLKAKNASDILQDLSAASQAIDSEDSPSAMAILNFIRDNLGKASEFDEGICRYFEDIEEMRYKLNDMYRGIEAFADKVSRDSENLHILEERLDTINLLKKKYGASIEKILLYRRDLDQRILELRNFSVRREDLLLELNGLEEEYKALSEELSGSRKRGAKALSEQVTESLRDLNFKTAEFRVRFKEAEGVNPMGFDRVEFMVKLNAGLDFSPLKKTASGGELSRVMLALQEVIGNAYSIPTMVLDEIDTGLSGDAANAVAKKIYRVSNNRQIISISHMLQTALYADHHYLIEKNELEGKSFTNIRLLDKEARVDEIYRLISSDEDVPGLRVDAAKLLENVEILKTKINN